MKKKNQERVGIIFQRRIQIIYNGDFIFGVLKRLKDSRS